MTSQSERNEAIRGLISEARQLTVLVGKQFNPELARLDLTIASAAMLRRLARGPATVPDLARRLLMSRQATQRFIDELASTGRVARLPNPRHARSPFYALTPEGQRTIERADAAEAAFLERLELEDPGAELRNAASSVARLREALRPRADSPTEE